VATMALTTVSFVCTYPAVAAVLTFLLFSVSLQTLVFGAGANNSKTLNICIA
jgi:hypothetical protein